MLKLQNYLGLINLLLFSFFIFILLPFIKTGFTIDQDLAPKLFITSFFVLFYSTSLFFTKNNLLEISDANRKIFFVIAAILLWMLITITFSQNKGDAFFELSRILILYGVFLISFILFQRSHQSIAIITRASAFAVLIFVFIGVVQLYKLMINYNSQLSPSISYSITSSLANKNFFAEVLVLFSPLLIIGIYQNNYLWRALFIIALSLNLCTLLLLQSLAAGLAIIFSLVFFIFLSKKFNLKLLNLYLFNKYRYIILIFFTLLLTTGFYFFSHTSASKKLFIKYKTVTEYISNPTLLTTTREENNNSVFERLIMWRNSINMISDYPIMGVGLNNWKIYNPIYGIGGTQLTNNGYVNYEHPHNDYLLIWTEQGPVGIILYLLLFFLIIREGFKFHNKSDSKSKLPKILLLIGVFSFMMLSLFAYPRSRFYSMIILMILFALILSQNNVIKNKTLPLKPIAIVMFIVSILGVITSYYRIIGEMHTKKVQIFQLRQDFSRMIREADKAYSWFYPMDLTSTPLSWYKGMAYFDSGLLKDAIFEYEKAIKINPNHLRLLNDIATSYERNNQKREAIYYYRKALSISPLFPEANLNISATYFNSNNTDSAFYFIDKFYSKSIQNDVTNYKEFLETILYAKSIEIIKSEKDSLLSNKMLQLVSDKTSLRHIYDLSKEENQPFAKYLLNYSKTN